MSSLASTLSPTWYWYFARGTGVVSLLLLTAIMVLGILGPLRVATRTFPRFAVETIHRDLSLLAVAVIAVHVVASVLDGFAPIYLQDAVIPFISAYRGLWLGLGAVAFDLMLALILTSLIRRRLGYKAWRWVHLLAYASWPVAVAHGLGTGSDAASSWSMLITFACVAAVAVAGLMRVIRVLDIPQAWRTTAVVATLAIPVALAVFAVVGPLAPHWAARAGTPTSLLHGAK
jgi:predicted ferric reductase